MNKILKNKNWLYEKYILKDLSCKQIANLINCHQETIRKNLKKHHIKLKGNPKGSKSSHWKNGRHKEPNGYIKVYCPNHPKSDPKNFIREHILVMEKYLGRYLKDKETVHHINKNKSDNKIENLMLFPNLSEHIKFEHKNGTYK